MTGDAGGAPAMQPGTSGEGGAPPDQPQTTATATSWNFDSEAELADWQVDAGVEQSFSVVDADGNGDSGSLLVTSALRSDSGDLFVSVGTSLCASVEGGVVYDIAARVEIEQGQGAGSGGFDVEFLDGAACDGGLLDSTTYITATVGNWELGEKKPTAPAGARSAQFRLFASKRGSDPPFSVRFDDVRFERQ